MLNAKIRTVKTAWKVNLRFRMDIISFKSDYFASTSKKTFGIFSLISVVESFQI